MKLAPPLEAQMCNIIYVGTTLYIQSVLLSRDICFQFFSLSLYILENVSQNILRDFSLSPPAPLSPQTIERKRKTNDECKK